MRAETRVLADDLSGALDASVCLFRAGEAVVGWSGPRADLSVLSTNTRDLGQHEVAATIALAADWLLEARLPFLKCDSRLRGNLAAEIATLIACRSPRQIIIAPALPAMGRVLEDGRLLCLSVSGMGWTTEPTDLFRQLMALGHTVIRRAPLSPAEEGIFLCDARTDGDLDAIVTRGGDGALWCGSSGLAAALARRDQLPPPVTFPMAGQMLLLVGTAHPLTLAQISDLEKIDPDSIYHIAPDGSDADMVSARIAAGKSCLVTVQVPLETAGLEAATVIDESFRRLLSRIPRPARLMVTGGATLQSVATRLMTKALRIEGQFAPGVPVARLVGGEWHGLVVASKSGGFGDVGLFSKIFSEQH
jgi:uncharacterized protein YgbK (DUF1537 family)